MSDPRSTGNSFLEKVTQIVEENLSNERFGVSELAREVGMSRSNLLRKVNKLTGVSVSRFIRNVRLQHAMEMLRQGEVTVSEVSYKVGFSSPSYFIKCFHDYYGHPPGEVAKGNSSGGPAEISGANVEEPEANATQSGTEPKKKNLSTRLAVGVLTVAILAVTLVFSGVFDDIFGDKPAETKKSIAVLPFINDSNDSTNIYIINGLMESTLNYLQKIEGLRVISRTSVEKYRRNPKSIQEIGKELNVTYLIEGSGQKIGDRIRLNIQLIDAQNDKHLWSQEYDREIEDIFALQSEVAKKITGAIRVIITPEEKERIEKFPTDNVVAYDYFLKGLDLLNKPIGDNAMNSIPYFLKAIENDETFARAYSGVAMAYYLLDENKVEKKYADSINYYADKALFYDPKLPQGLIAKALFYMTGKEYELAIPYFEKALEYKPNYDLAILFLVDLYVNRYPDTEKYLEYALKGLELDLLGAYDSATVSLSYLHISNAFIQSGFVDEAERFIDISLDFDPGNLFSEYVKAYILYARNRDLEQTRLLLNKALDKAPNRYDIMQELAKIYYYQRDYENAYVYYKRYLDIKNLLNLDIYNTEDAKIALVMKEIGLEAESENLFAKFKMYADNDRSVYRHINLAMYYAYHNDTEKALEHFERFAEQENYHYWTVIFTPIDPLLDNIRDLPEFRKTMRDIEKKFSAYHKKVRKSLQNKGLL